MNAVNILSTPPPSEQPLALALKEWRADLGKDNVSVEVDTLEKLGEATFATNQRILAELKAHSREDVQAAVKTADRHGIKLYAVSCGKNWGLGSKVPTADQCVVLDLSGLNEIVDFDEKLGYATVQPGVTFRQISTFLRNRNSNRFAAVIGGSPEASVVGNALERGDGIGPYGDRAAHICKLEIVLADGSCFRSGFGQFENASSEKVHAQGVGPSLDGLFCQSNFGVVTELTLWLAPRPESFQSFSVSVQDTDKLPDLLRALRKAHTLNVIQPRCVALWNAYKALAATSQFPWDSGQPRPLPQSYANEHGSMWKDAGWVASGGLYSASQSHAKADRKILKQLLKSHVQRLLFMTRLRLRLLSLLAPLLRRIPSLKGIDRMIQLSYAESPFLGVPSNMNLKSLYWRKKIPIPGEVDPNRDRCGMLALCFALPWRTKQVMEGLRLIEDTSREFQFEPNIAVVFPSERAVQLFPFIIYDRDCEESERQARQCHKTLLQRMAASGHHPYRLGIQSMSVLGENAQPEYAKVISRLKTALDPNGTLSPGRYEYAPK